MPQSTLSWEEFAQTLFEEAGDALFLFDPDTEQLLEVNPMAQRLSGFSRKALRGMTVTALFRSEGQGALARLKQAFRRTGLFHSQEGFWLRTQREGAWLPVNLTVTRLHLDLGTRGLITARDVSEQRAAHARVQKVEAELRRVLASVSDCLWSGEIDAAGAWRYSFFSPVVERLTGRPPESFVGDAGRWLGVVHPDDRPRLERLFAGLRQGRPGAADYRILRPDGGVRWVRDSVMVSRQADGPAAVLDGVLADVTDRRRAEQALRESEARHRLLLAQLPAIVWATDAGLRITSLGGAGLADIGLAPDETVGASLADFFQTADPADPPVAAHRRALQGESVSYDVTFRGRSFQAHVEPLRGPAGQPAGVIGVGVDNTDHLRAVQALRASEAKYRFLIDNLTQCVFLKDRDLRFTVVNPPFCRAVGLDEAAVLGKTDFDLYPPGLAEKYARDDRRVLATNQRLEQEEEGLLGGRPRTIRVVKTPVCDDEGRPVGVLGIFWDVTAQRQLEGQLRQAQKMEAVGQLASGIAHDFNNLLAVMLGSVEMARAELADGHACQELLDNVQQAGFRAAELTRQMLSFARQTPLQPRPLSLDRSVEETVGLLRRTLDPRIAVEVRPGPGLWPVQADAAQMNQVLMNLCLNARDAMPEGGTLSLATANVALDPDAARAFPDGRPGEFVRLRVGDTGCGMAPEVQAHLFEPFFTTKDVGKGTGLGLAMVFGIVRQHDGWIACRSAVGRGTTFEIYLPRLTEAAAAAAGPAAADLVGGRETILLADDQEMIVRLIAEILGRLGYRVLTAADGAEAVELYRRHAGEIDLVLLDLVMPNLTGRDTLRVLRQLNPGVRVLVYSGSFSDEAVGELEREGAAGFLSKPYRVVDLAQKIRTILDHLPAGPA